jgi:hypothetical protein
VELIALSGAPCAGKTTVGRELEKRGYLFIDFSDIIKQEAAKALTAAGMPTTVEEIRANKPKYRAFLQELGVLIGFDTDPKYVWHSLGVYGWHDGKLAVFDNVRTAEQFQVLQPLGFKLVRIEADFETRATRAEQKYGVSPEEFIEQETRPIERGLGLDPDVVLDSRLSPDFLARILIDLRVDEAA